MTINNLQEALNNIPQADADAEYAQQLKDALAYWQSVQSAPATADQGSDYDTVADDGSGVLTDATAAIALIQAELARIGD